MATKPIKFDKAISRLEEIVYLLEHNEEDLEQLLVLYEEGAKLLKTCKKQLTTFENKLEILAKNETEETSLTETE
jgi:exodeoxyribonuclease VII small subunit